jgi:hypothetical protein
MAAVGDDTEDVHKREEVAADAEEILRMDSAGEGSHRPVAADLGAESRQEAQEGPGVAVPQEVAEVGDFLEQPVGNSAEEEEVAAGVGRPAVAVADRPGEVEAECLHFHSELTEEVPVGH